MELALLLAAISGLAIFLSFRWNKSRLVEVRDLQLYPNCLITRFPIVFLQGRQSVLYFGSYWNAIPDFLTEHGYEIIEMNLPWRNPAARVTELQRFLEVAVDENLPCHFFVSADSPELLAVLQSQPNVVRSINTLSASDFSITPQAHTPLLWWFHKQLFSKGIQLDPRSIGLVDLSELRLVGRVFLNTCVQIAESDFQLGVSQHVGHSTGTNNTSRAEI